MYFATKIKKNSAKSKDFTEFWSEWGDSNSRHLAPKASALPTALHPDILSIIAGVRISVQPIGNVTGRIFEGIHDLPTST